ncbi:hypothetical protein A2707_00190 [Candidatus Saccharibacteria bacterium RIFCSPHIGHO2_01_FULL_45_15]|nr:MAG: hypothetical protein A2707_00190 [Candidatus Saccharibacteria bacterium RIFCSPHIGHO2_01_FULL_45_15]OGL28537.1 MAG: hypothetical protein A3C39_03750 [Candidatus Saccharibacteria bacterium RIFCSPHIGHO2_02_FULL_46_12]OGL32250.1 MAG: hypothetical protein A3E76_06350 [Candidatus Saccharibacteria bacterium RIFCSPHIGHO2_12_FULL_44_22]
MFIIDKDSKPQDTVYYTSACILDILKRKSYDSIEDLRIDTEKKFGINIKYPTFISALNFLFLIDKIKINNEVVECT